MHAKVKRVCYRGAPGLLQRRSRRRRQLERKEEQRKEGYGGKGGGDIGLGEGEGKTMRREIVPLLLLHESKQADQERERREGKRCGEGGKG